MITAQDIREKTFEKSKFAGYDMASVDDFLEELAEDFTAAQKENAVLKSKMKVLVDKIEEYRTNEDALNKAVLSAQKLAVQIEAEARQRANAMIAEAEKEVKAKVGSIEELTKQQERRLADAKAATTKFIDGVRSLCNTQLKNIDAISSGLVASAETEKPAAKPSVEDAIRSIEDSVAKAKPEAQIAFDFDEDADVKKVDKLEKTQPFSL